MKGARRKSGASGREGHARARRARLALGGALALAVVVSAAARAPQAEGEPDAASAPLPGLAVELDAKVRARIARHSPLPPLSPSPANAVADDPRAARLGRFLFFDEGLSSTGTVSCATCHDPAQGFGDGKSLAVGISRLDRHSQSLWNVAHNRWFFWDGRSDSLWSQALQPLEDAREMGSTRLAVAHRLHKDAALRAAYAALFGALPPLDDAARFPAAGRPVPGDAEHPHARAWAGMTEADRRAVDRVFANVGKALAAYQRRLTASRSPFDVFVEGLAEEDPEKLAALDPSAQRGLALFFGRANCRLCHHGPTFSDLEFHNNLVPPLAADLPLDKGRADGIERVRADAFNALSEHVDARDEAAVLRLETLKDAPESWGAFKTPSLRNVALSPPYMHQGQLATLEDVVRYYSTLEDAVVPRGHRERILVPQEFSDVEVADLVAFLESLTDEGVAPELLRAPTSPLPPPPKTTAESEAGGLAR